MAITWGPDRSRTLLLPRGRHIPSTPSDFPRAPPSLPPRAGTTCTPPSPTWLQPTSSPFPRRAPGEPPLAMAAWPCGMPTDPSSPWFLVPARLRADTPPRATHEVHTDGAETWSRLASGRLTEAGHLDSSLDHCSPQGFVLTVTRTNRSHIRIQATATSQASWVPAGSLAQAVEPRPFAGIPRGSLMALIERMAADQSPARLQKATNATLLLLTQSVTSADLSWTVRVKQCTTGRRATSGEGLLNVRGIHQ